MESFTTEQRTKTVEIFFTKQQSIVETQRAYRPHANCPSRWAIRRLIQHFRAQGSVTNLPRTGRPRTIQIAATIERVKDSVAEDATTSTRRRSSQLRLSRTSLQRILKNLHIFPYKNLHLFPQDGAPVHTARA